MFKVLLAKSGPSTLLRWEKQAFSKFTLFRIEYRKATESDVNENVRTLKLTLGSYWPQEFLTFFNLFHEMFPCLHDFRVELVNTDIYNVSIHLFTFNGTIILFMNIICLHFQDKIPNFIEILRHLAKIKNRLNEDLEKWGMTFNLTGTIYFLVFKNKEFAKSFEESTKSVRGLTVIKTENDYGTKFTLSLSHTELNFCFNVWFWREKYS